MLKCIQLTLLVFATIAFACDKNQKEPDQLIKWAGQSEDTLYLSRDLILVNIYKDQLLHYEDFKNSKDSVKLMKHLGALYDKYLGPWGPDGCFVWNQEEFIKFNKVNAFNYYEPIYRRVAHLFHSNIDSVLTRTFNSVSEFSGYPIQGKYHLYFMPQEMKGFDMGGCDINTMQVNLSNQKLEIDEIQKLFPHELNHQIYEVSSENDPNYGTVLWGIIDEGFATYFEKIFNSSDKLASLQFNKEDFKWCLDHESEIYAKAKQIFLSTNMEDEQKLRGNQGKYLIKGAPYRLNYFLGYRIINKYVETKGVDSWRDIYNKPVIDVLLESKYEESL